MQTWRRGQALSNRNSLYSNSRVRSRIRSRRVYTVTCTESIMRTTNSKHRRQRMSEARPAGPDKR